MGVGGQKRNMKGEYSAIKRGCGWGGPITLMHGTQGMGQGRV